MNKVSDNKSDIEVLCPDIEVEGYRLRPWGLKQTVTLIPIFHSLKRDMEEKKITFEKFVNLKSGDILDFALMFSPFVIDILSITLGVPKEEVESFDLEKTVVLLLGIIDQNIVHLKNSFGLVTKKITVMKLASLKQ